LPDFGVQPVHGPPWRADAASARQDSWENPDFSNHNSARLAMRLHIEIMRHSAYAKSQREGPFLGQKSTFFDSWLRA
jgi:hypothetical protein